MRRACWLLMLVLLAGVGVGGEPQKGPVWLSSVETALAAARASGRPIFAVIRCRH